VASTYEFATEDEARAFWLGMSAAGWNRGLVTDLETGEVIGDGDLEEIANAMGA
jgi:hypothetical protein